MTAMTLRMTKLLRSFKREVASEFAILAPP
jgi:hypothetical protein